ncbi:hypothetical protein Drorol1_Dr00016767 [Drosera rotundifolia]
MPGGAGAEVVDDVDGEGNAPATGSFAGEKCRDWVGWWVDVLGFKVLRNHQCLCSSVVWLAPTGSQSYADLQ